MKIHLNLGKWSYTLEQDEETGQMEVLSHTPFGLLNKAKAYVKAEASGLVGSVSLPVLGQRHATCESCESLKIVKSDVWYCKSCGVPRVGAQSVAGEVGIAGGYLSIEEVDGVR